MNTSRSACNTGSNSSKAGDVDPFLSLCSPLIRLSPRSAAAKAEDDYHHLVPVSYKVEQKTLSR